MKILGPKHFMLKKFFCPINFKPQNMFGYEKNFWVKKIIMLKKDWAQESFGNKILAQAVVVPVGRRLGG